ncbi:RNA polymerase sigma factor [Candidatus Poribacteria bacterium]|nr:RNA polymerase sigma factor [Candidatus Poribacteria bacterium]
MRGQVGSLTLNGISGIVARVDGTGDRIETTQSPAPALENTAGHPNATHAVGVDQNRSTQHLRDATEFDDATADAELIEAAQAGDTRAFDVLMQRYRSRVFMLAYQKTKSYEDALDITQETFVRAFLALPKWRPQASWYTWLFRITYNLCIDFHRARSRRRTESLDEPESQIPEPATSGFASRPDRVAEENELADIIRDAVDGLSDRQREVFVLHHYGGLQVKEVAEALAIAEGTAKIHLFRAVAKLREVLRPMREGHHI